MKCSNLHRPKCPNCKNDDVQLINRWIALSYVKAKKNKRWQCCACGCEWIGEKIFIAGIKNYPCVKADAKFFIQLKQRLPFLKKLDRDKIIKLAEFLNVCKVKNLNNAIDMLLRIGR